MADGNKPQKPGVEKRTISLSPEQAAFIDAKVASGGYTSASEVVREGLRAMQAHDAALERFLKTEVVATLKALDANPDSALPIDEAFAEVRARIAARRQAKHAAS